MAAAISVALRNKRKLQLQQKDLDSISRAGSDRDGSIAEFKPTFDPASQLNFRQLSQLKVLFLGFFSSKSKFYMPSTINI